MLTWTLRFVLGHGDVVLLLTLVVVGIDENLGQVFEIGDVTISTKPGTHCLRCLDRVD